MVYFQQSLFGKMSWERFHQMTGWILEPSYPLSQTPMFQCLLLEDGQEPEWCEGERLTSLGGSWIYKAFPGCFRGGRYVFPSVPVFAEILSTSKQQDFGTFCPEVPAERRNNA